MRCWRVGIGSGCVLWYGLLPETQCCWWLGCCAPLCRGIGLALTRKLAALGFRVILGCRNATKGREAVESVVQPLEASHPDVRTRVSTMLLDVSSLASVRQFCSVAEGR